MRDLTADEREIVAGGWAFDEYRGEDGGGGGEYCAGEVVITARRGGWWPSNWWSNLRRRTPTPPPPSDDSGGGGSDSSDPYSEEGASDRASLFAEDGDLPILKPGHDTLDYLPQANALLERLTPVEKAAMGAYLIAIGAGMEARGSFVGEHIREMGAWITGNNANMLASALSRCTSSDWVKDNVGMVNLQMIAVLNGIILQGLATALAFPGGN
jgi:hypothetical protein